MGATARHYGGRMTGLAELSAAYDRGQLGSDAMIWQCRVGRQEDIMAVMVKELQDLFRYLFELFAVQIHVHVQERR
jgi:hypothetical protein